MHENKIEELRNKMKIFREDLEKATMEKGLAAEENKDLRENSAYDYWDEKERALLFRIRKIAKEISEESNKNKPQKKAVKAKSKAQKKPFEIKPRKWL